MLFAKSRYVGPSRIRPDIDSNLAFYPAYLLLPLAKAILVSFMSGKSKPMIS